MFIDLLPVIDSSSGNAPIPFAILSGSRFNLSGYFSYLHRDGSISRPYSNLL
ncbi:MAG: hypothetical protein M1529_07520 [Candidatus Thermoplasmatota archaeon]|nr:hypothetical protein [Candidatus Thermoplasmatota archaeon]